MVIMSALHRLQCHTQKFTIAFSGHCILVVWKISVVGTSTVVTFSMYTNTLLGILINSSAVALHFHFSLCSALMIQVFCKWVLEPIHASRAGCAHATTHSPFPFFPSSFPLPCMISCCESVCTRRTLINPFSSFQTPDTTHLCAAIMAVPIPISRLPPRTHARHVLEDTLPLLSDSLLILTHVPLQTSPPSNVYRAYSVPHGYGYTGGLGDTGHTDTCTVPCGTD